MLDLYDGTLWHLHSRCFEIKCSCFGLDCYIYPCNSIALHLAVYFGKVESFLKGSVFLITTLKNIQRLLLLAYNFYYVWTKLFPNRWPLLSCNSAVFSLSNAFVLRGPFNKVFKMFRRCVYETDSNAWPSRSVVCSISVANVSAGTSSRDKGPITCKTFFPETFPSANQSR